MFEGKTGIIWTLDKICEWNCDFCCVDSYGIEKNGDSITVRSNSFNYQEPLSSSEDIYQQGQDILVRHGLSLSLEDKFKILENLKGSNIEIGFSGGDFLLNRENLEVIKKASTMFGKENIGITATGVGMRIGHIEDYLKYIGQLDFTFDNTDENDENHQQPGYNDSNLISFRKIVENCHAEKVITQALVPISNTNKNPDTITNLYSTLKDTTVDQVYLMRTLPVGRGLHSQLEPLSPDDYRSVIEKYYELEKELSGPRVGVMCALKYLFPEKWDDPCTFLRSTIDITSIGDLIADAFAYGLKGEPLLQEIVFGNLKENHFSELITRQQIQDLAKRVHENKGHCKIMAYLNNSSAGINGLFSKTDPLYTEK